jgi:hypothetical protein
VDQNVGSLGGKNHHIPGPEAFSRECCREPGASDADFGLGDCRAEKDKLDKCFLNEGLL